MPGIRLPKEIDDRLAALAKATNRTKSYYIRESITRYLDAMENDLLAEAAALRAKQKLHGFGGPEKL